MKILSKQPHQKRAGDTKYLPYSSQKKQNKKWIRKKKKKKKLKPKFDQFNFGKSDDSSFLKYTHALSLHTSLF